VEADIEMKQAEQESSIKANNMVPVSAQHKTNNSNGGNAFRRNESILTENVSECINFNRGTMTTMEEIMKLSVRQT
jgi:hypothetical protein